MFTRQTIIFALGACAGLSFLAGSVVFYYATTPQSRDECILMNIGNAKNDRATSVVYRVCQDRFSKKETQPKIKKKTPIEHEKVKELLSQCVDDKLDEQKKEILKEAFKRNLI